MSPETLRRILEPDPGTALARAKEYGIDLTLLVENARKTPEQCFDQAQGAARFIEEFRRSARPA
jgi:hypothetical protein